MFVLELFTISLRENKNNMNNPIRISESKYVCFIFLALSLLFATTIQADGMPQVSGWIQTFDQNTGTYFYKREKAPHHSIKFFPAEPLKGTSVNKWFNRKWSRLQPPEGRWMSKAKKAKRTSDTQSAASRAYNDKNKTTKLIAAMATTIDKQTVHFGALYNFGAEDKGYKKSISIFEELLQSFSQNTASKQLATEASSTAGQTEGTNSANFDLATENAAIPESNHPVSAVATIEIEVKLLPTRSVGVGHMMMTFPNGYSTHCNKWDLISQNPTPASIGSSCKLTSEPQDDKALHPFNPGETIDAVLAGVRDDNWLSSNSSLSAKRTITLTKEGKITLGSGTLSKLGIETTRKSISGRYYLNGYTITIETESGDLIHSHIGLLSKKNGNTNSLFFHDNYYTTK